MNKKTALMTLLALGAAGAAPAGERIAQTALKDGLHLSLSVEPGPGHSLVRLEVADASSNRPLSGARPLAWLTARDPKAGPDACGKAVDGFLQGRITQRPDVDFNAWYLLALNASGSISVVDPLVGLGRSRMVAMVPLPEPAADWAAGPDGRHVYASLPKAGAVAVVDTRTWKVARTLKLGGTPRRLAVQPGGGALWATDGARPLLWMIKGDTPRRIRLDKPVRELAFDPDGRRAVAVLENGAVVVLDATAGTVLARHPHGGAPLRPAYSAKDRAFHVAEGAHGRVLVVDAESGGELARYRVADNLASFSFTPDGRWAVALASQPAQALFVDAALRQVVRGLPVPGGSDQVAFTPSTAFVRSSATPEVTAIPLATIAEGGAAAVVAAGQAAPGALAGAALAPAPEGNAVLVANPAEKRIHYYMEGMAAPAGGFENAGRVPAAIMVLDRSLRAVRPGRFETSVALPSAGEWDLAVLVPGPTKVAHCFPISLGKPAAAKAPAATIAFVDPPKIVSVGQPVPVRVRLDSRKPSDLRAVLMPANGTWKRFLTVTAKGKGLHEVALNAAEPGTYYLFVEAPAAGLPLRQAPHIIVEARK